MSIYFLRCSCCPFEIQKGLARWDDAVKKKNRCRIGLGCFDVINGHPVRAVLPENRENFENSKRNANTNNSAQHVIDAHIVFASPPIHPNSLSEIYDWTKITKT